MHPALPALLRRYRPRLPEALWPVAEALAAEALAAASASASATVAPDDDGAPAAAPLSSTVALAPPSPSAATVALDDDAPPAPAPRTPSAPTVALDDDAPPAPAPPPAGLPLPDRYDDLGPIARGGMGEVRRVRDRALGRTLALKVVHASLLRSPAALARFEAEARATAQLQHPNIVPVHDLGRLPDGRAWFTMKEVRGRTLAEVAADAAAGAPGRGLRGLISAFHTVCQAVAYAHARGVVHRDLKPDNVMIGAYGEVVVLDWGLAKVLDAAPIDGDEVDGDEALGEPPEAPLAHSVGARPATRAGLVAGTPAYMPPEQARGDARAIDARSDVYALGAMLYELLSGRAPYGGGAHEALASVLRGPPPALQPTGPQGAAPDELVAACARAMARDPADRFPTAEALAAAVQDWLDGAKRREQALEVVARAQAKGPEREALRARAAGLRAEAAARLAGVEPWRPEADKHAGWALEDAADALDRQAAHLDLDEEHLLSAALTHAPDLPEAHAALARRHRTALAAAEAARADPHLPELRLRHHVGALPAAHPERAGHLRALQGDGALTLCTDPPGAEVLLHRFVLRDRRLVPVFERALGRTPLREAPLPMGSYLCELRHPDRAPVRYPVHIARGEHWHGAPAEGGDPRPVRLPLPGELGEDDVYVPAGWFWSGGDPDAIHALPRARLWLDAFVIRRSPVTNAEYISFLDDLVAQGREDEALEHAPRERPGSAGARGALIYGYGAGRFSLRPDADGDAWQPDWPVFMVPWTAAAAFAAWTAARSGLPWQLPREQQWEKAARGVDARAYPWGDAFDPSWACTRDSHPGRALPAAVSAFPVDESVYGVRGCAGNLRDWCLDEGSTGAGGSSTGPPAAASRVFRGGSWYSVAQYARLAFRGQCGPEVRDSFLGVRLLRPAP